MSDITFSLNLNDLGTIKKKTAETKELNSELTKAVSNASKMGAPRAGYRAAAATASESTSYGQARGSMGSTGAEGRDFANQAQGLGGLVRVYATLAANLFAVSAAFTALKNAADTTNMIKGMDQLGAASGIALGTLSKQLVQVTGGAISMREAMEATTKSSAAGMSTKQILQMGEVARKASQALGISMPDAISRLSRGISKLEPELLDELGLFTKLQKSTEDYARSIGKPVSALTDLERRQSFANAALKEGLDKFGDINIDINPYDKLLASLKNIAQAGLELVNKVLGPLVSFLASSPTALGAVIAGIGISLIRQAIPALSDYRAGLRSAVESSKELSEARSKAAQAAIAARDKEALAFKDTKADIATEKINVSQSALEAAKSGRIRKDVRKILDKTPLEVTDADIAKLTKLGTSLKSTSNVYVQLAKDISAAKAANLEYMAAADAVAAKQAKGPGRFSAAGIAVAQAETARKKASSSAIISKASETTAIEGIGAAFAEVNRSVKADNLGAVRGSFTKLAAGVSIATTAVTGFLSAFSKVFMVIGIAVAVFQTLNGFLSKNAEATAKFSTSLDTLKDSTKTATDVQAKYGDTLSVQSTLAKSNAILNLSDSLITTVAALKKLEADAGIWDRLIDSFKDLFGKGVQDTFAKNISTSVSEGLKVISDPKLKQDAETRLKALLNTEDLSGNGVSKAIKNLAVKDVVKTGEAITGVFEKLSLESTKAAAPLTAVVEGFKALDLSYTELSNSLNNKDPLTKFALDLIKQTSNLTNAFENPQNKLAVLKSLLEDTSKIQMFPAEAQQSILAAARGIEDINRAIVQSETNMAQASRKITASNQLEASGAAPEVFMRIRMEGEGLLASATEVYKQSTQQLSLINTNITNGLSKSMSDGFKLLEAPLTRAYAQANIDTQKTLLGFLPKTSETAKLTASLEIQSIELRKQEISSIQNLINSNHALRLTNENIELDRKKREFTATSDFASANAIQKTITKNEDLKTALTSKNLNQDLKDAEKTPELAAIISQRAGVAAQLAGLSGQQITASIRGVVESVINGYAATKEILQREIDKIKAENALFYQSDTFLKMPPADQAANKLGRAAEEQRGADNLAIAAANEKIAVALTIQGQRNVSPAVKSIASAAVDKGLADLANLTAQQKVAADTAAAEGARSIAVKTITDQVSKQNMLAESAYLTQKDSIVASKQDLEFKKEQLGMLISNNQLSKQEAGARQAVLTISEAELDKKSALLDIENERNKALAEWNIKYAESNYQVTAALEAERALILSKATISENAANRDLANKTRSADLIRENTTRQAEFNVMFQDSMLSMSDSLVDFALTGKQSFGDMIQSMIVDLAKLEMRMILTNQLKQVGGLSGILGSIAGAIAPGASAGSALNTTGVSLGAFAAKGAAYAGGVEAFALGGAFTNSIVNKPTLFPFAQGTGLMGEAGPEAIMPLKRDSSGNLGVRSASGSGSTTQVVVNNYTTEKAKTTESVDSRGNRRIEVIVGEMVAQEVGRSGSSVNRSIANNFNTTQNLVRR